MEGKLSSSKGISNALFLFYPPLSNSPFINAQLSKPRTVLYIPIQTILFSSSSPQPNPSQLLPTSVSTPHTHPKLSGSPPTPPQTSYPPHPPSYSSRPFPHHQTHAPYPNLSHTYPPPAKAVGIGRLGDRGLVLKPWNRVCLVQGRGCILSVFVSLSPQKDGSAYHV